MSFDQNELLKIAHLARLSLTADEVKRFQNELGPIVDFVAQLSEVDVTGVLPMSHAGDRSLHLCEDVSHPVLGLKCISSSAGYEDGLVRVPKIIE
jgi:aspartyl-tRNA(Asn)/glutamyl-tRNA(Gln) amidotransferase subunit C